MYPEIHFNTCTNAHRDVATFEVDGIVLNMKNRNLKNGT